MVLHTSNDRIIECALVGAANMMGQEQYTKYTLNLKVWIDSTVARRAEAYVRDSPVKAVWEAPNVIQSRISDVAGRYLETGDLIRLESQPNRWYVLGEAQRDSGLFNSFPMQKFNLNESDVTP